MSERVRRPRKNFKEKEENRKFASVRSKKKLIGVGYKDKA
jgi:hypothetical protein